MRAFDIEDAYNKINEAVRFGIERLSEVGAQLQHIAEDGAKTVQKNLDSIDIPKFRDFDITPVKKSFDENRTAWIVAGAVAVGLVAGLMIADSARHRSRR
jgi:hypothetical protein